MKITVVTAFPELVRNYLGASVLGRGIASGKIDANVADIRDFADGDYRQIDDYSFGGGGMVLMAEPLARAVESAGGERYVVFPSPQGVPLTQELVEDLARRAEHTHLVIVCGHYEGADERFVRTFVDLEISLGDFVITGGELPAMAIVDAVARLAPGVVGKESSVIEDSFYAGLLDNAHYTRPAEWRGESVPEVLTGGDHAAITRHRRREAAMRTLTRRPEAVAHAAIGDYLSHGAYVILSRDGEASEDEVLDIARACRVYGVKKFVVALRDAAKREAVKAFAGNRPEAAETLSLVKTTPSVAKALAWISEKEKTAPFAIMTETSQAADAQHWTSLKREILRRDEPVAFLFGGGREAAQAVMHPIRGATDFCALSASGAAAIVLDRFFGWR